VRRGVFPTGLIAVAVCAVSLAAGTPANAAGDWHSDLESAFAEARESDRPVLVHFSATWCGPCRQMEPVLHSRTVANLLRNDAVGAHLDFDRNKAVAQQYGVRGIPADVLLTPDGKILGQMSGLKQPDDYAMRVRAVATQYVSLKSRPKPKLVPRIARNEPEPRRIGRRVQDPSWQMQLAAPDGSEDDPGLGPAVPDAALQGAFGDSDRPDAPAADTYGDFPDPFPAGPGTDSLSNGGSTDGGTTDANSRVGTPRVARRPTRKLLGMRGFCPVTLHERREWVRGSHDYQWEHQGITYFLANEKAFDKFYENADRFAPKLLGCDPVLYRDTGRAVPGSTTHAAIWRNELFLFVSAENRTKFKADPSRYANDRQVLLIEEIEGIGTF